ncbi:hypothetical protein FB45DRAFT_1059923 [Roridomyces roridus]|uniref:Uncharacterized protein n=1 Tax=Roridomyces roridus TaxID=1738132 RepID=A0AAD7BQ08_9AGAR|nr:hypothetical protein FB45DRAFT_1059923 [Roridomyces roridus]
MDPNLRFLNEDVPRTAQPTNAIFSHSKHFIINGGTFTNINHQPAMNPPNFPMISMGSVLLNREVGSVVYRRRGINTVRRVMYSAEVVGVRAPMTAAIIEGAGAQESWREEVSRYLDVRHPYLLQLYCVANTGRVGAIVFHDSLVQYTEFRDQYDQSHFSQVFLWACIDRQLQMAGQYISVQSWSDHSVWILPDKGTVTVDLVLPDSWDNTLGHYACNFRPPNTSFKNPPPKDELLNLMSVDTYHRVCSWYLSEDTWFTCPTNTSVKLGCIFHAAGQEIQQSFEVASFSDVKGVDLGWGTQDRIIPVHWNPIEIGEGIFILEPGWIRVDSTSVLDKYCRVFYLNDGSEPWLAQACHVLEALEVESNMGEYFLAYDVEYHLHLLGLDEDSPPPAGYLFLCPQLPHDSCSSSSDLAYWSIDPLGEERLTAEDASMLGFPTIQLEVKVLGRSWNDEVYAGIRQLYVAKGYEPNTLDVGAELGYPICEMSCTEGAFIAHLSEVGTKMDGIVLDVAPEKTAWLQVQPHPSPQIGNVYVTLALALVVGCLGLVDSSYFCQI